MLEAKSAVEVFARRESIDSTRAASLLEKNASGMLSPAPLKRGFISKAAAKLGWGELGFGKIAPPGGPAVGAFQRAGELWFAARHPEKVDAAASGAKLDWTDSRPWAKIPPSSFAGSGGAYLAAHLTMVLGKGSAGSGVFQAGSGYFTKSVIRKYFEAREKKPMCHVAELVAWEIAADEALDSRHPALAMAWMSRAQAAEASGDKESMRRCAGSLARSMAGFADPDGLHPDFARGVEESRWAELRIEGIVAMAGPLSRSLAEARALAEAVGGETACAAKKSQSI